MTVYKELSTRPFLHIYNGIERYWPRCFLRQALWSFFVRHQFYAGEQAKTDALTVHKVLYTILLKSYIVDLTNLTQTFIRYISGGFVGDCSKWIEAASNWRNNFNRTYVSSEVNVRAHKANKQVGWLS